MTAAPDWFRHALQAPVSTHEVEVEGASIRYRAWGDRANPGLVLIHGGAAHNRWWDHVGPTLARTYRVIAPDLSGHGDSDRRGAYAIDGWASEVMAVAEADRPEERPILVGHSLGGLVAYAAATRFPERMRGIAMIDSLLRETPSAELEKRRGRANGLPSFYPDRASALERFRLIPEQVDPLDYVLAHLADTSVRRIGGGWGWKFDPLIFVHQDMDLDRPFPPATPVTYLRAERGIVTPEMLEAMRGRLGNQLTVTEIPLATHHAMVDQPLALTEAIGAAANMLMPTGHGLGR